MAAKSARSRASRPVRSDITDLTPSVTLEDVRMAFYSIEAVVKMIDDVNGKTDLAAVVPLLVHECQRGSAMIDELGRLDLRSAAEDVIELYRAPGWDALVGEHDGGPEHGGGYVSLSELEEALGMLDRALQGGAE